MPALRQLCHIAYGPLASRLREAPTVSPRELDAGGFNPALVLSGQDFDADGYPTSDTAGEDLAQAGQLVYAPADVIDSFGVSPQTLLYLAKGSQHRPCLPKFESSLPLITGSSFIRLEVKDTSRLLRDYLFAQLCSTQVWRQLETRQEGAFIKNINRSALADLEVDVPPVRRQEAVVEYARLHRQAQHLRSRLNDLNQQRLNAMLTDQR